MGMSCSNVTYSRRILIAILGMGAGPNMYHHRYGGGAAQKRDTAA